MNRPSCGDCYFLRHGLCALALERPCPTFRAAAPRLEPPRQASLLERPSLAAGLAPAAYTAAAA